MLTRDEILGADDLVTEEIMVPEWGDKLRVRTMTGTERDAWNVRRTNDDGERDMVDFSARLCVACVVDEEGTRIFTDSDAPRLGAKNGKAVDEVFSVAAKLNGLGDKDAAKNSETTPSDSSGSD